MKLAIVVSHPIQYYSPWFRWLSLHAGIHLKVFYLSDWGLVESRDPGFGQNVRWDTDLLSGYEHVFIANRALRPDTVSFGGMVNPGLPLALASWEPDAILLFGYKSPSLLAALAWARLAGVPVLFRGDSHLLGGRRLSAKAEALLSTLYAQCSVFLAVGKANSRYFSSLGVPAHRIIRCPHCVDADHFDPTREDGADARNALELRKLMGLQPEDKVLLYCGKFHADKNPHGLLAAFRRVNQAGWHLVLAGAGPEKQTLMQMAGAQVESRIHFLPFANQGEMPARYLLGDVFCLPSTGLYETWGLAVNEAMLMGRPCLVSDRVGCAEDLIEDGQTGWVFDACNEHALEQALRIAFRADLPAMGRAARRKALGFSYAAASAALLHALEACGLTDKTEQIRL